MAATSLTLMWRPAKPATLPAPATVFLGPAPAAYTLSFTGSVATGALDAVVPITGLTPSTRYYYAVCTTTACAPVTPNMTFVTSPAYGAPAPLRAWVIGDMGMGLPITNTMLGNAKAWMATNGRQSPADMWLFLGDDAYETGSDSQYSSGLFQFFAADLPHTPLWTQLGNHDTSSNVSGQSGPYFARFATPRNGEAGGVPSHSGAYYSFDYGGVHVIALNSWSSTNTPGSPMLQWLAQDLAAIDRTSTQWLIAFWHHCTYSHGTHNSDSEIESIQMRGNVLPLLEAAGVDLILNGHSHAYERSYLVSGNYGLSTTFNASKNIVQASLGGGVLGGTPYTKPPGLSSARGFVAITTGGGAALESTSYGYKHPAMVPFNVSGLNGLITLGTAILDVTSTQLTWTYICSNGTVADSFTIVKS